MPYPRPQCPRLSADHDSFSKIHDHRSRGRLDHRAAPTSALRRRSRLTARVREQPVITHGNRTATTSRLTSKSRITPNRNLYLSNRHIRIWVRGTSDMGVRLESYRVLSRARAT